LNSFGHPVPFVAGRLQRTGRKARGTPVRTEFTADRDTVALDLRSCYDVEGLERLEREFVYSRTAGGDLAVTDTVAFREPQAFGTALVTFDPAPRIEGARITVGPDGGSVVVDVEAEGAKPVITATALEADLPHGRRAIRIGIDLDALIAAGRIGVRIRPAGPAAGD
ncbi:MAG: heparinase, partial [Planctomycetota bacterium]